LNILRFLLISAALAPVAASAQMTGVPAALAPAVDAYIAPLQALDVFSGVVLVARGDTVLFEKAYGLAEREHGIAMTTGSVFRIASITKSFTRALAGRLAERGEVSLDAPIGRWLPDFEGADRITLRLLLDHRAGVPNVNSLPHDEESFGGNSLAALVDTLARMPLDFEPGSAYRYSNGGYAVATRLMELAGGGSYGALLQEHILGSVGLSHTRDEEDAQIVAGRARGYAPSPVVFGRTVHAPFQEMATKVGGGSLLSTAGDLHLWALALGRHPVLALATWAELFPRRDAWALTGRTPGYNVALLREGDLVAIVLVNSYAAGMTYEVARALIDVAAGRTPEPLAVAAPGLADSAAAAAAPGRYRLPVEYLPLAAEMAFEIRPMGEHLVALLGDVPVDVLVPQPDGSFLLRTLWSLVTFEPSAGAGSPGLQLRTLYRDASYRAPRIEASPR
jgi:CubicO group peptidase (beta-lactamase class C family)